MAALVPWAALAVAVADWTALKVGVLTHPPELLALLVGLAALALVARAVLRGVACVRAGKAAAGAEAVLILGLLVTLGAGSANWLLGLQGFVILHEGERVPLARGAHLQELVQGPLARVEEMAVELGLENVELLPVGAAAARSFVPRSTLWVARGGEEGRRLEVEPGRFAVAGPLRFHQGAFGFAPRIVIERDGTRVFDRVVPFTTERREPRAGARGIAFEGAFTLDREDLRVDGRVDLASLDAGMRGHATLDLGVRKDGRLLGRGRLLPGHFAEIGEGYRVGFAGLESWSEILLSRRGYGNVLLGGAAVAACGLLGLVAVPVARRLRK